MVGRQENESSRKSPAIPAESTVGNLNPSQQEKLLADYYQWLTEIAELLSTKLFYTENGKPVPSELKYIIRDLQEFYFELAQQYGSDKASKLIEQFEAEIIEHSEIISPQLALELVRLFRDPRDFLALLADELKTEEFLLELIKKSPSIYAFSPEAAQANPELLLTALHQGYGKVSLYPEFLQVPLAELDQQTFEQVANALLNFSPEGWLILEKDFSALRDKFSLILLSKLLIRNALESQRGLRLETLTPLLTAFAESDDSFDSKTEAEIKEFLSRLPIPEFLSYSQKLAILALPLSVRKPLVEVVFTRLSSYAAEQVGEWVASVRQLQRTTDQQLTFPDVDAQLEKIVMEIYERDPYASIYVDPNEEGWSAFPNTKAAFELLLEQQRQNRAVADRNRQLQLAQLLSNRQSKK